MKIKNYYKDILDKFKPIMVEPFDNSKEQLDYALKKFKRKVDNSGILETFKKKQFYVKPSELRKQKYKNKS